MNISPSLFLLIGEGIICFLVLLWIIREFNRDKNKILPKPKLNSLIWFYDLYGRVHILEPIKDYNVEKLYWIWNGKTLFEEGDCCPFGIAFVHKRNLFKSKMFRDLKQEDKETIKYTWKGNKL